METVNGQEIDSEIVMLKKLDLYILKRYFKTFFFIVFLLSTVVIMIDFTDHNDDFLSNNIPYSVVIDQYYINLALWLATFLSPMAIFISTIVVTARMAAHTEIVAILSSGISFRRILRSYFIGAVLLGGLTLWMVGWVIPKATIERVAFEQSYFGDRKSYSEKNIHVMMSHNTKAYVQTYNINSQTGYHFVLEKFEGNDLVERLKTNKVHWNKEKQLWHISKYSLRKRIDGKEDLTFHPAQDTILNLSTDDLENNHIVTSMYTIPQLREYIEEQRLKGVMSVESLLVDYYERYTYPIAIIVLTLIAVISGGKKSREGVVLRVVIGFLLFFTYWIVLQMGRNFAEDSSIHPAASAALPNVVFLFLGWIMYRKMPK